LKSDSVWIQWIHHFYLRDSSIWSAQTHASASPLWKSILLLKNQLVEDSGDHVQAIGLLRGWAQSSGSFTSNACAYFRFCGSVVSWHKVVWESWSLPRYSFILWLAMLGKLKTNDQLHFFTTYPIYVFCR